MSNMTLRPLICSSSILLICLIIQPQAKFMLGLMQVSNNLNSYNKKKPVHIIEFKQFEFHNYVFWREKVVILWHKTTFDRQGRKSEVVSYKSNGEYNGKSIYKYDSHGNNIERTAYDAKDAVELRVSYKYDTRNRLLEEIWYQPSFAGIASGNHRRTIVIYDDDRREKIIMQYDGLNMLVQKTIVSYNLDGTEREEICENPTKGYAICPFGRRAYKYDSRGNQIEQLQYDLAGEHTGSIIRRYNDQNVLAEWEMPGLSRITYDLNQDGSKNESTAFTRNGEVAARVKYDSSGEEQIRVGRGSDGKLAKDFYQRRYDKYGNLVEKIWYRKVADQSYKSIPLSDWLTDEKDKGRVMQILEYTITYFE